MTVRTRMAPSPTGEYHIGHIRTVLYNVALSKKMGGKFLLRIEDTDRHRYVEGATDRILDVIGDYGLSWDEGPRVGGEFGPYIQSERLSLYEKYAKELIAKKNAYYCFCSEESLNELRNSQQAKGMPSTKYDKKCLNLSEEEIKKNLSDGKPYVIRLNVPANRDVTFHDEVFGDITINTDSIDDQILLKSDGYPSYHLAVVVDDHLMNITHVMRGNDWIPSTPKHVLLYEAFGWEQPKYIHLPNLKEKGGTKKLSKRFGPVSAIQFLEEGYLAEALLNFLMFLGWNPGTEKEIYSLEEFINDFDISRIHKTDLVAFDREKLLWINGYYIRQLSPEDLHTVFLNWANKFSIVLNPGLIDRNIGPKVLSLVQERVKKLSEVSAMTPYFFDNPKVDSTLLSEFAKEANPKDILTNFWLFYKNIVNWDKENLDTLSHDFIKKKGYKPKEAFMTLRIAVTGAVATPPLFDTLEFIGKKTTLLRIESAIKILS
ncbi:glutamate--tRNA ligase [candidate division WWE3 bacterium]|nr:glutamate--tRNA ligase [candidate division WWE3 bacterium]